MPELAIIATLLWGAAIALAENTKLSAREIVEKSMSIAARTCIYTNESFVFEELS